MQRDSGLPRVSVIVRAYNSERYIGKALDSVLAQSYAGPIDIIVLYDRGTADGTARVLGAYGDVKAPNRSVAVVEHEHTTPFRALQIGLERALGGPSDYVGFLDSDNVMDGAYLERAIEAASRSGATFLFSELELIDEEGRPLGRALVEVPRKNPYDAARLIRGNWVDVNGIVIARGCAAEIAGRLARLSHRYFDWIFEDWLMAMLAFDACRPLFIDHVRNYYRLHGGNLTYGVGGDRYKVMFNSERDLKTLAAYDALVEMDARRRRAWEISVLRRQLDLLLILEGRGGWTMRFVSLVSRAARKAAELGV
ncbi:MAG: glycosyltransferase [Acidilobus sp.]|jgi:glycosyltransferase involved in cell wall biosynthesis